MTLRMRRMWTVIWMAHFQQSKVVARWITDCIRNHVQRDAKAQHVEWLESVHKEKKVQYVAEKSEQNSVQMQRLVIWMTLRMRRMWTVIWIWMAHFQQSKVVARRIRDHAQRDQEAENVEWLERRIRSQHAQRDEEAQHVEDVQKDQEVTTVANELNQTVALQMELLVIWMMV